MRKLPRKAPYSILQHKYNCFSLTLIFNLQWPLNVTVVPRKFNENKTPLVSAMTVETGAGKNN
jgi:hypothetical protein